MSFADKVELGRTGISVSRLGIGSGYGVSSGACERAYHEHGINFFYPALPKRGAIKTALKNLRGERGKLVVAIQSYDHVGLFLRGSLERQLRGFGLDYADVLLLGWFNRTPNRRILDAAAAMKESGRVRAVAMSGHHRPTFGALARDPECPIDIFMIRYNAAHRGAEGDIFPHFGEERRQGVIAYTATCWGKLLDPKRMPAGEDPMTAPECYRFALSSDCVDVSLCGPASDAEMAEAATALSAGALSDAELDRFRRIGDHVHG